MTKTLSAIEVGLYQSLPLDDEKHYRCRKRLTWWAKAPHLVGKATHLVGKAPHLVGKAPHLVGKKRFSKSTHFNRVY